jgi:hypothetical protein
MEASLLRMAGNAAQLSRSYFFCSKPNRRRQARRIASACRVVTLALAIR